MRQPSLAEQRNPYCLVRDYTADNDTHCFSSGLHKDGYEVLAEDHPDADLWLESVGGADLMRIKALDIPVPTLPRFLPTVSGRTRGIQAGLPVKTVGILLEDVVSKKRLTVAKDLNKLTGTPPGTKFVLLSYGHDELLENIWPNKEKVIGELAKLGFVAVTGLNYSVFDDQPHLERRINMKRGLITFDIFQRLGVSAIPHIYWATRKDLDDWAEWLNQNTCVKAVACNLQTLKPATGSEYWRRSVLDLAYLQSKLKEPRQFIITGPSTPGRISDCWEACGACTISNSQAIRAAAFRKLVGPDLMIWQSSVDKKLLAAQNIASYTSFCGGRRIRDHKANQSAKVAIPPQLILI